MIARQYRDIYARLKTMTRRKKKANEELIGGVVYSTSKRGQRRRKHYVGQVVSIVPKYGQAAVLIAPDGRVVTDDLAELTRAEMISSDRTARQCLLDRDYRPLQVRITAIREERLQVIPPDDARREGVESVEAYRELWASINGPRSWDKNPTVYVYTFVCITESAAVKEIAS